MASYRNFRIPDFRFPFGKHLWLDLMVCSPTSEIFLPPNAPGGYADHICSFLVLGDKFRVWQDIFKFYQYILGEVAMTTYTDYFDARR